MNTYSKPFYFPKKSRTSLRKRIRKAQNFSAIPPDTAATATPEERSIFIRQTYLHLAGEIGVFVGLEAILFSLGFGQNLATVFLELRWGLLLVLLAFLLIIWFGRVLICFENSKKIQYFGLGVCIIIEVIMFAPLLYLIERKTNLSLILEAGAVTIGLFLGITSLAFLTKKELSFLFQILIIGTLMSLGLIVADIFLGFSSRGVVALITVGIAAGWILLYTSKILHRYQTNQYIEASLSLFNSIIWLFWSVLRAYSISSKINVSENQSKS